MPGEIVDVSKPCTAPERIVIHGKHVDLVPWEHAHTEQIWPLLEMPASAPLWEWWPAGPYYDIESYTNDVKEFYTATDPIFYSMIEPKSKQCQGHAILGELSVEHRRIEAGMFITLPMQRTTAVTEAFYLIASYAFDLGFRRLQWETNSLNMQSRNAAERFGFSLDGIHRQHSIQKGRSRDNAWYSIIDGEWPVRKLAFEKWLDPSNFDAEGKQKRDLVSIRRELEIDQDSETSNST